MSKTALWDKFLSATRVTDSKKTSPGARSPFEIDNDAIIWSDPFRRLVDKTQVFPLPDNDHIHNRLTHSLEVASVGRSIATTVAKGLAEREKVQASAVQDIPNIVAAACLSHDIGNPPFGHSGEKSIGYWVAAKREQLKSHGVERVVLDELERFEGNAIGFRILVRHQQPDDGGLRLTYATLAAGAKYPCSRAGGLKPKEQGIHRKKFGFLMSEANLFREVAHGTGMKWDGDDVWKRHPLAWLVEAADDIANSLIDVEDGFRAGAIAYEEVILALRPLAARHPKFLSNEPRYVASGRRGYVAALRSLALAILNDEVSANFLKSVDAVEAGDHNIPFLELSESSEHIKNVVQPMLYKHCFRSESVLRLEIAGNRIISYLLDNLVEAVLFNPNADHGKKLLEVLGLEIDKTMSASVQLAEIVQFVSGMTDGFALRTFRLLSGVVLPGRLG
ncbi:MAG: dGTP triphosphohydrolase [Archangium sp.]